MTNCETAMCGAYRTFGSAISQVQTVEEAKQLGYCELCLRELAARIVTVVPTK